jgi:peptide deformylase
MPPREIVTLPNEILRRKARDVDDFGPELQTLIDDMIETMRVAPGVGLAAPQVDVPLRVIVVEFGREDDPEAPKKLYTVVNPEIRRASSEEVEGLEGCLSIPELVGEVDRSVAVTVTGQNRHGQPLKIKAKDWLARIFQHEVDHVNGVLFVDRATRVFVPEPEEFPEHQGTEV